MSGVVAIFNPLVVPDPRFVDQHDRISHRSHLEETEKNKIRLSQTLRMGHGSVTILFSLLATVATAKVKTAFVCVQAVKTCGSGCADKSAHGRRWRSMPLGLFIGSVLPSCFPVRNTEVSPQLSGEEIRDLVFFSRFVGK